MKKILVVLETFEQGMERKEGGVIKLFANSKLPATSTEHGLQVAVDGRVRTIPPALLKKLEGAGLVRVEDPAAAPVVP